VVFTHSPYIDCVITVGKYLDTSQTVCFWVLMESHFKGFSSAWLACRQEKKPKTSGCDTASIIAM